MPVSSSPNTKLHVSQNPWGFTYPKTLQTQHGKYLCWYSITNAEIYFKDERLFVHLRLRDGYGQPVEQEPEGQETLSLALAMSDWLTPDRLRKLRLSHSLRRDTSDDNS